MIEIKFREDLEVRTDDGQLRSRSGRSLDAVRAVLERHRLIEARPLFEASAGRLEELTRTAAARSGKPVPDLASWYHLVFPADADVNLVVAELEALPEVEHAYPAPEPVPPPR